MRKVYNERVVAFFAPLLDLLFPPRESERVVRALVEDDVRMLLSPERVRTKEIYAVALMPFKDERVRSLIHETKYHGSERAAQLLSAALAEYLVAYSEDAIDPAVLVPVPLSSARYRERGFNQCERVLRFALMRLPGSFTLDEQAVSRVSDTEHQTRLSREERRKNVMNAFSATNIDPARHYLLFDDVITTGATLAAAQAALKEAGAVHVRALALAR